MSYCEPPFPACEPVAYTEPVYVEPVAYTEPVYVEPVAYTEPVYVEPVAYTEPVYFEPVYTDVAVDQAAIDAQITQMVTDQQLSILNSNMAAHNQVMADATREIDMRVDYDYSGDIGDW